MVPFLNLDVEAETKRNHVGGGLQTLRIVRDVETMGRDRGPNAIHEVSFDLERPVLLEIEPYRDGLIENVTVVTRKQARNRLGRMQESRVVGSNLQPRGKPVGGGRKEHRVLRDSIRQRMTGQGQRHVARLRTKLGG